MTRVNVLPPSELVRQHCFAECREIVRVFSFARKATQQYGNASAWAKDKKPPASYVLGTVHVRFFVLRVQYLAQRYADLCKEWRMRVCNVNQLPEQDILEGIDKSFFGEYTPTPCAMKINRERIALRLTESAAKAAARKEKK